MVRSPDSFANGGGSYRLRWDPPEDLTLEFERLDVTRREFTATVRATSTAPGESGLLHQERLNLESGISRDRFAGRLAKRTKGTGLDWDEVIQNACLKVLDAYRAGAAPVSLRDVPDEAESPGLLSPLLKMRELTIVHGDGGSTKSLLALAAAIDAQSGTADLLGLPVSRKVRVGILDAEGTKYRWRDRARKLAGDEFPGLVYIESTGPLCDQVERLQRIRRDEELEFLVLDSVGFLCDGPPEEAASALRFGAAFRQLGIGGLGIAHNNRAGDTDRPFGSTFWFNSARLTWYIKKQQDTGTNSVTVGLYNKKDNDGPLHKPLGWRFTFGDSIRVMRVDDIRSVPDLAGELSVRYRVTGVMESASGPWSYQDLASELEVSPEAVRKAIERDLGKSFVLVKTVNRTNYFGLSARVTT